MAGPVVRTNTRINPTALVRALVRYFVFILLLNGAISLVNAQVIQNPAIQEQRRRNPVKAQELQTFANEEQRRRSQAEAQERQRQLQAPNVDLQTTVPAEEAASSLVLPTESPCFTIQQLVLDVPAQIPPAIRLAGASALPLDPFRFAQDYLDRYAGACIGMRGLNLIVQRLTNLILAH